MKKEADTFAEEVLLHGDSGTSLRFTGRLYSESSYFDEETGMLTRLRLYLANDGRHVYSIVSSSGAAKSRRYYTIVPNGDLFDLSNGDFSITVSLELLFASVFGLCHIDPDRAEELRTDFEESLRVCSG